MDSFKRTAFYQEFSFLRTIKRDPEACQRILVKRVNVDLLHRRPNRYRIVGPVTHIDEGDEILLFSQAGQPLGQVKTGCEYYDQTADPIDHPPQPGETLLEAIYRRGVAGQVYYIVWVVYGYKFVNSHSQPDWWATIYKPAKAFTIAEVVAQSEAIARARVVAEGDF